MIEKENLTNKFKRKSQFALSVNKMKLQVINNVASVSIIWFYIQLEILNEVYKIVNISGMRF